MRLPAIHRKFVREIVLLRGQIATIALVLAGGVICFIALLGTYQSLRTARDAYYDRYRFAHVFARLEHAPLSLAGRIEALPGVAVTETRVVKEVTLPMEGRPRAANALLLSIPASREPSTNALRLVAGRLPEFGRDDEAVVIEAFATANALLPGDVLPAVINGKLRKLKIVGIALSPEFVYAIRPGALAEDPKSYAVVWMERTALASALRLDGAFNEVNLRLEPGASEAAVLASLDRLLAPYGGNGAIGRTSQTSNRILEGELGQLGALAGMVPVVFLGVAAFLINVVLTRLIGLQRTDIAALKAIGYGNGEIALHYLAFVFVIVISGGALGVAGGYELGKSVLGLYAELLRLPDLKFQISSGLVAVALLASTVTAVVGALWAVRGAAHLPPAEAMRPPTPARYRRGIVERFGLRSLVGTGGTMVVREIERRPLRTVLSSLGIAGAVGLVIFGHCGTDALDGYLESIYRREQPQDLTVSFVRPVPPRAVHELRVQPGVRAVEGIRAIPIRARHDHLWRDSVLFGMPNLGTLRRLVARGGVAVPVPEDGVLVTTELGKLLGLHVGDHPELELREGAHRMVRPVVDGFVDESVGLQIYATESTVARLSRDEGAVSSALLTVDARERASVERFLRRSPEVVDVADVVSEVKNLREMNGRAIDVWTFVSITLSACVVFGVVYNNARIALATRSRDLASLRILGMSRNEISSILIAELSVQVLIAIPFGLWLGHGLAEVFFARAVDQETFRFPVLIEHKTYALAAGVALVSALVSAIWIHRNVERLDLIGVLKTRE